MAFFGFLDEFSNSPIQQAYSSLLTLPLTGTTIGSVQLEWSFQNPNTTTPFSQLIYIAQNTATGTITLPDASFATISQNIIVYNTGGSTVTLNTFTGSPINEVAGGEAWYFVLVDNSTDGGTWAAFPLGLTNTPISVIGLIDPNPDANNHPESGGLGAFADIGGTYLKQNNVTFTASGTTGAPPYTQAQGDRGNILIWDVGSGVYNCLPCTTMGNGFAFAIYNGTAGSQISVKPNGTDLIDNTYTNVSPFVLQPGESSYFYSDGVSNIYTLGFIPTSNSTINRNPVPLSQTSPIIIPQNEAQFLIQFFEGTGLINPAPTVVEYPLNLNQFYFYNSSTDTTVQVKVMGGASSYNLLPGERLIAYSDEADLYNLPTYVLLSDATLANPSLSFVNDPATGMYRAASPVSLNFGVTGTNILKLIPNGQAVNSGLVSTFPATLSSVYLSNPETITAPTSPSITPTFTTAQINFTSVATDANGIIFSGTTSGNVEVGFGLSGNLTLLSSVTTNKSFLPFLFPDGAMATPSIAFVNAPTTGVFRVPSSPGPESLNFTIDGTTNLTLSATEISSLLPLLVPKVEVGNGTTALPTLTFVGGPTTGVYRGIGPESLNFTVSTTTVLTLTATSIISPFPLVVPSIEVGNGTNLLPSITFSAGTTTGLYRVTGPERLNFTVGTVIALTLYDNSVSSTFPGTFDSILVGNGTVTTPSLTFSSEDSVGLYLDTAQLQVATSGVPIFSFGTSSSDTVCHTPFDVAPTTVTDVVSYQDSGISLYSLMRAYG